MAQIRNYFLWLHGQQGSELAAHLADYESRPPKAFETYGHRLLTASRICKHMAKVLDTIDVTLHVGGANICVEPGDDKAAKALDVLVAEGILQCDVYDDDDDLAEL